MICAYAAQPCTLYIAAVAVSGRYFPESNALGVSRPVWVDQAEGLIGREVRSFRKSRNSRHDLLATTCDRGPRLEMLTLIMAFSCLLPLKSASDRDRKELSSAL